LEALAVIWSPVSALARVVEERRVLLGFSVTALYAALSLIGASLAVFGGLTQAQFQQPGGPAPPPMLEDLLPAINVFSVVFAAASPFVLWLLVSGLMHLVTRFFGGTGPFSRMLAAVGVAQVPFVIASVLQLPVVGLEAALDPHGTPAAIAGLLSSLLGLLALLWFIVLVVIGAALARQVGYGESAGSCAISCTGCVVLILIVVVFVVLVAVLVGAAGSGGPS
jgi:hypothetical protein